MSDRLVGGKTSMRHSEAERNGADKARADISGFYDHWFEKTGSADAAATLVLAQVQASGTIPPAQTAAGLSSTQQNTPSGALSVRQVAEQLGVSKETVYKLCGDGSMPHSRIGRRVVISREQLAEFQSRPAFRHLTV
jgi:excisionase family DNA binding protein